MISIDTELKWGFRFHPEKQLARMLQNHEHSAIAAIHSLLELFEIYEVPATWAIVGKLFVERPEIINEIRGTTIKHEVGYHSWSHIRFAESSRTAAKMELDEGLKIEEEFGIDFKSFVFPENKIGHVDLLREYGFLIYRGPNSAGRSVNKSLPIRAKNFALFKIIAPPVEPRWKETIWEIPSSMMFYDLPYFQTLTFRAKQGIKKAIEAASTFHLFIHPEDALLDPKLLDRLEKVLQFVKTKAEKKELHPITMDDFVEVVSRSR